MLDVSLFNYSIRQAFVNTCYLQSFIKTNTCTRGKKIYITSLDKQYLKKKKSKKKSTFVSYKMISHAFSSFR